MLEGFIPKVKGVLPMILIGWLFFLCVFLNTASAQVTIGPDGSIIRPALIPELGTVNGNPDQTQNTGGAGGTGGTGGVAADSGNAANPVSERRTIEQPAVQVEQSASCWSSADGFLNCLVVSFFGSLVAIAGYTFDSAIGLFITGFGSLYISAGIGATVENVWETVRDVFNLTFIFGLVYIGFQIILGTNESSAKRTIPLLIMAALLVNFSLFIVKFIIDFANLAAVQIFNLFVTNPSSIDNRTPTSGVIDFLANNVLAGPDSPSIALAFMNSIGVSGLLNYNVLEGSEGTPIMYLFVMIVIFLVLTYVFFAGAILITIRFAVLIFYMIFSPIMFLGWVFPGMKSYSDKFWSGLLGQAFFAPALLFMLYISYRLTEGFNDGKRTGVDSVGNSPDNIAAFAQFMPYLVVVVIFLLGSLIISKKMASQGADAVGKINNWALGKVKGGLIAGGIAATYPVRAGTRMGVNTAGSKLETKLNNLQARDSTLGRLASMNAVDRTLRGGVEKMQKAELKTGTTNKAEKEYRQKTRARASQTTAENERDAAVADAENAFKNAAIGADDLNAAIEKLAKSVSKMSSDELVSSSMKDKLYKSQYAVSLTDSQITDLEKGGKLSSADIAKIKSAREQGYTNIAYSGTAFGNSTDTPAALRNAASGYSSTVYNRQRSALASKNITEIGKLPAKIFSEPEFTTHLTPLMLAERMKNGLSVSDAGSIRRNLESFLNGNMVVNNTSITPTAKQIEMWRRWTDNTDRGAEFGLNVP